MAVSLPWQRCSTVHPASLAKHPQTWTKEEIGAWLSWCTEEYSIEPVPADKFDLNGKALCLLSRSDFMERVPRNGDVLFNCLQTLISKHTGSGVLFHPSLQGSSSVQDVYQPFTGEQRSSKPSPITACLAAVPRSGYVPIKPHPYISVPVGHSQDTLNTLVRSNIHPGEQVCPRSSSLLEQRPLALEHSLDSLRHDASSDCRLLWEFIYQLLSNTKYSNYVCWEDKESYVFRIVNPTGLAELWGQQKNRTNMTYEKLSRALRYYYRMNIIKKVQGKRLTYRFLQPPSCIQKGQRGAKPHYKIQMDMILDQGSQQYIKKEPDSPASSCATATASYSPSVEEGYKSSNEDMRDEESDHGSSLHDIGSTRSSPESRIPIDMELTPERRESTSIFSSRTKSPISTQNVPPSLLSTPIHFHHGIKHTAYSTIPPFAEQMYSSHVKPESHIHPYISPQTSRRENYLAYHRDTVTHPSLHVSSDRMKIPFTHVLEKNVRYQEGIFRSLSSDFAQSLQVQPYALRPTQPRSVSPRIEVQEEPQDLTTRKRARTTIDSYTESQRPQSFSFSGYSSGNSGVVTSSDSPKPTCHESL